MTQGLRRAQGVLRTKETVDRFKAVPPTPGQSSPLLVYFGTLLTRGRLNKFESVELAQLVVAQNKKHLLDNWLREVCTLGLRHKVFYDSMIWGAGRCSWSDIVQALLSGETACQMPELCCEYVTCAVCGSCWLCVCMMLYASMTHAGAFMLKGPSVTLGKGQGAAGALGGHACVLFVRRPVHWADFIQDKMHIGPIWARRTSWSRARAWATC